MISQQQHDELWQYIKHFKVAMLTSEDDHVLRSRPMQLLQNNYNGKLWFFTRKSAHKTSEVAENEHVNLSFMDEKHQTYVSLSGDARLNEDSELIDKFWNTFVSAWFPEGKDSTDLALLEVEVHAGEYWDAKENKMMQLMEMARAKATREQPALGEHEQIS